MIPWTNKEKAEILSLYVELWPQSESYLLKEQSTVRSLWLKDMQAYDPEIVRLALEEIHGAQEYNRVPTRKLFRIHALEQKTKRDALRSVHMRHFNKEGPTISWREFVESTNWLRHKWANRDWVMKWYPKWKAGADFMDSLR